GVIALRLADPNRPRKFRVPGGLPWAAAASVVLVGGAFLIPGPWSEKLPFLLIAIPILWIFNAFTLPLLGIAACGYLILNLPMTSILRFVAWLNIGLVIYCGYGVAHSKLQQSKGTQLDSAEHKTNMALMGVMLAIVGVFLAIGVRALEIFEEYSIGQQPISKWQLLWERADSMFHYGAWMGVSWFFIVPLVGNGLCLCPLLMWRLSRKDTQTKIAALEKRRKLALTVSAVIILGTTGYLIAVFGHRLVS
ncbi:MAG TPA: amino acid permease C-terminal domain-containing protein, partial [Chthoniobacterales bacterium]